MNKLAMQIIDAGYADRVLTERQLARILGGSDDSRYGLVKRALQAGSLIRIKRGRYVLANQYRTRPVHPFRVAQALVVGSYVSMETALAFHGWIPEVVFTVASVTPGRKSAEIDLPEFGRFSFHPLAHHKLAFLNGVERHTINDQPMLIAKPLRALLDIAAYKKVEWEGMRWITKGMRIDLELLLKIPKKEFSTLRQVYRHKAVLEFLRALEQELTNFKARQQELATEGSQ